MPRYVSLVVALLLCSGSLAGCITQSGGTSPQDTATLPSDEASAVDAQTTTSAHPETIDRELWRLRTAANRSEYARTHDLVYQNGSTEVVVVLEPGRDLSPTVGTIESVHDNEMVLRLPVDHLERLADHRNVSYIRTPARPVAD